MWRKREFLRERLIWWYFLRIKWGNIVPSWLWMVLSVLGKWLIVWFPEVVDMQNSGMSWCLKCVALMELFFSGTPLIFCLTSPIFILLLRTILRFRFNSYSLPRVRSSWHKISTMRNHLICRFKEKLEVVKWMNTLFWIWNEFVCDHVLTPSWLWSLRKNNRLMT